mgnify:CR=1 FL=1
MTDTAAPDFEQLRFLVVEDHGFQRWYTRDLLERAGASRVFSAHDGHSALEICTNVDPPVDIIVTDLSMPGMDGIEFIRHVADIGMPASLILATEQDASIITSVEAMAHAFGVHVIASIRKPLTESKLRTAVRRFRPAGRTMSRPAIHTLPLERILAGIRDGEFEPYFQPKVEMATGYLRGAEVMARWRHPTEGLVMPSAFIGVLEESGHIDELTALVLRKAATTARHWNARGVRASVAVNLSLSSLGDTRLADRFAAIVADCGLAPKDVIFEITESTETSELGRVLENLSRLRMKGFGLSIDDYGMGYSSMKQLTRIPFTELKIDKTFVRNASLNGASQAMLETTLDMARKLSLVAVAEGVETKQEFEMLRGLGCDLAQGYYIAHPMAAPDFIRWADDHRSGNGESLADRPYRPS